MSNLLKITSPETEKRLANNLHYLIKSQGLSESDVAQALEIPVMTVRRIISGETTDPRISTLKLLADYFKVTIDALIESQDELTLNLVRKNKPLFVPILDWETAEKSPSLKGINLANWLEWQPIHYPDANEIDQNSFALKSLPSMYPRFPKGTLFIIAPTIRPSDGDIVLIRIKDNGEISLKELIIDPPEKKLASIIDATQINLYSEKKYEVLGVVTLTLLFTKRNT